jgi:hypothetical protein
MSSATSIEDVLPRKGGSHKLTESGGSRTPDPDTRGSRLQAEDQPAPFRVWHFFVLLSLMASTVAVVLARQATPEHLVLLSLTIGAAGACGVGVFRMLAPLAAADTSIVGEALSEGTRAALEREKMLVLRSIKELEFDRAMGKVSPQDFDEMAGRLRGRALTIMRQLDEGIAYRDRIEKELQARLGNAGVKPRAATASPAPASGTLQDVQPRACAGCGANNDADAAFCKRCGGRLTHA